MLKNPQIPRDFFGGQADPDEAEASPRRPAAAEEGKVQVTIYLTDAVAMSLEQMRYQLMMEYGIKASKSAIAQYAIQTAAKDVEALAKGLGG